MLTCRRPIFIIEFRLALALLSCPSAALVVLVDVSLSFKLTTWRHGTLLGRQPASQPHERLFVPMRSRAQLPSSFQSLFINLTAPTANKWLHWRQQNNFNSNLVLALLSCCGWPAVGGALSGANKQTECKHSSACPLR